MRPGRLLILGLVLGLLVASAMVVKNLVLPKLLFAPTDSSLPVGVGSSVETVEDIKVVVSNLLIPWELVELPSGDWLVTERSGTLLKLHTKREAVEIKEVVHVGEGGLLGMTLHPNFLGNHWIYLYLTTSKGDSLVNRVERYRFDDNNLLDKKTIIDDIPAAMYHDGGRIKFGPDNKLYIATGDASRSQLAQDKNSLAGKILRINDDGSIPEDNPFSNAVYSYGHRNVQGLAWDNQGRLWATEHGPSGTGSGFDELNLIKPGVNYGWPHIKGDEVRTNMATPIANSGANETWAPASAIYWDNSIFFTGLRGEGLYEAKINGETVEMQVHFKGEYGRLRAITIGEDGNFYISTSNTDGRGKADDADDKIIRVNPQIFRKS